MSSNFGLTYEYKPGRTEPHEVFESIGLYIEAYRSYVELISESAGLDVDWCFALEEVKEGSIRSLIQTARKNISSGIERAVLNGGNEIFQEISGKKIKTEKDVEEVAEKMDFHIQKALREQGFSVMGDVFIDRKKLAKSLSDFSKAGKKAKPGEVVKVANDEAYEDEKVINEKWSFDGDADEMFKGEMVSHTAELRLTPVIAVYKGNRAWEFKCFTLNRNLRAVFKDVEWLSDYQKGKVPFSPGDVMSATVDYQVEVSRSNKPKGDIHDAKIIKVHGIKRSNSAQFGW